MLNLGGDLLFDDARFCMKLGLRIEIRIRRYQRLLVDKQNCTHDDCTKSCQVMKEVRRSHLLLPPTYLPRSATMAELGKWDLSGITLRSFAIVDLSLLCMTRSGVIQDFNRPTTSPLTFARRTFNFPESH